MQSKPAAASGWADAWTKPADARQERLQELQKKLEAAAKTHDYHAEVSLCTQGLQQEPDSLPLYYIRSYAYLHLDAYDPAMADTNHALGIAQARHLASASVHFLLRRARLHQYAGNYPAAAEDMQKAIDLNPRYPVSFNNLAWLRATAPDQSVLDGHRSIRLAQHAISLAGKESYSFMDTLAAAYAQTGDFTQAVSYEQRALAEAPGQIKDADRRQKFQQGGTDRLHLFEQHHPFREASKQLD